MNLIRFNSHRPTFPSVFNRFFHDDFLGTPVKYAFKNSPAVNVKENETSFGIEVAAPGFKKEDFKVALEDGNLVISAEVKTETEDKNEKFTRKEFSAQSFRRAFSLPEVVDAAQIDANYENGILFINLPKREEVVADKRKEIAIH